MSLKQWGIFTVLAAGLILASLDLTRSVSQGGDEEADDVVVNGWAVHGYADGQEIGYAWYPTQEQAEEARAIMQATRTTQGKYYDEVTIDREKRTVPRDSLPRSYKDQVDRSRELLDKIKEAREAVDRAKRIGRGEEPLWKAEERKLGDTIKEYKDRLKKSFDQAMEAKKTLTGGVRALTAAKFREVNQLIAKYNKERSDFQSAVGPKVRIGFSPLPPLKQPPRKDTDDRVNPDEANPDPADRVWVPVPRLLPRAAPPVRRPLIPGPVYRPSIPALNLWRDNQARKVDQLLPQRRAQPRRLKYDAVVRRMFPKPLPRDWTRSQPRPFRPDPRLPSARKDQRPARLSRPAPAKQQSSRPRGDVIYYDKSKNGTRGSPVRQTARASGRNLLRSPFQGRGSGRSMASNVSRPRLVNSLRRAPSGQGQGGNLALSPTRVSPRPVRASGGRKVGGVALRGASQALKDLGPLQGIAVDANGRLILIARDRGEIDLPPLRLDDVVTVFRSVYEKGDAPWVSIDPDPANPHGPTMNVVHSPGTANTYVGWVLFEADRIMKAYTLGTDNVTRQPVRSTVSGYRQTLDANFTKGRPKKAKPKGEGSRWERFWLVPARVSRLQSKDQRLTLLEVAIQVSTEAMIMRQGKLVSAPDGKSSRGALAFRRWFTDHYPELTHEARSAVPQDSGQGTEVAVLAELQRITLIAAIAEKLRDQGVPMPSWMRDYVVQPFPVPTTTPALTARLVKKHGRITRTLNTYGGATLSPPDRVVRTVTGAPAAEALAPVLWRALEQAPSFSAVAFEKDGKKYRAVALPGNDTQALGACRLEETDLAVPVEDEAFIGLSRFFHSFSQPEGELGHGWTLDLPRLLKQRRVTSRTEKTSYSRWVFQLTSPLGTHEECFAEQKQVPEAGYLLVPRSSREMLGLARRENDTRVLRFRDGREWHFDAEGYLVTVKEAALEVRYQWDRDRRLSRIEGWYGGEKRATIAFQYDARGRLVSARAGNAAVVRYSYDLDGQLTRVQRDQEVIGYEYREGLVTGVLDNGEVVRRFSYTKDGRLKRERREDGTDMVYAVRPTRDGVEVTAAPAGQRKQGETVVYDASFRPVSRRLADGTRLHWRYRDGGAEQLTARMPDGRHWEVARAADGSRQTTVRSRRGPVVKFNQDPAGRVTAVWENGRPVLRQQWGWDGQLAFAATHASELFPHYGKDRLLESVFLGGRKHGQRYAHWMKIEYDRAGRPLHATDYYGLNLRLRYDRDGQVTDWSSAQGNLRIKYGARGEVKAVEASWGQRQTNAYDARGRLTRTEVEEGGGKSVVEFAQGRPVKVRQFDGGELRVAYHEQGALQGRPRTVRAANGVELGYQYNVRRQLAEVDCGGAYRVRYTFDKHGRITGVAEFPAR